MKERATQQELWALNLATESGESVLQTLSLFPSFLFLLSFLLAKLIGSQSTGNLWMQSIYMGQPPRTQSRQKEVKEQEENIDKDL